MKEAIRNRALELGFDACRFTTAAAPASAGRFQEWIASGQHGDMTWLARNADKRADPQRVLPGARSVVCVALNYGLGPSQNADGRAQSPASDPPAPVGGDCVARDASGGGAGQTRRESARTTRNRHQGFLARYARHQDYHDVMGAGLRQLAEFMNELGGGTTRTRWYVDTGPILERDLAQQAGLGFVGKHTNLISRRFGNWILLGEVLTTLELEPDAPEQNRCGTCARCLAACPTQAITAPFQLDARRCISYLTIELKGPIPEEFRPALGHRIFGCDDCLEVCPWNRFASESRLLKSCRRADLDTPDLVELLALDGTSFKQRFRGTPMERGKRRGLLRNVCVALGNVGDAQALPALEKASQDPELLISEHAQWALRRITERLSVEPGPW
ncbi:MAG: tRNA epoxyqueuosine(34) reductase QueG [Verrucomicrobia bacterium]|jgi:epoxyqueuosine reductase|nr:tRNA epoxyqueuosine(34) reductase QueG [Verrucomicrobiota bacterium]